MKLKLKDDTEFTIINFQDIDGGIKATIESEFATVKSLTDEQLSKLEIIGDEGSTYKQLTNTEIASITMDMVTMYLTVELVSKSVKEQIANLQTQVKELQEVIAEQQTMLINLVQSGGK